jgi:hypothetical protein
MAVQTTDNSETLIDSQNNGFTVTMTTVSDLTSLTVQNTNDPKINGATDPYEVIVTTKTPAINGDKIELQFPTEITFPLTSSTLVCTAGTLVTTLTWTMTSSNQTITATITAFSSGTVAANTQFSFTISPLGNPISLASTNMQSARLLDSSNQEVNSYSTATSISIQNTQAGALTNQNLTQSSEVARASATYTFKFTPTNPIPQHAIIQMNYPSSITLPSASITCSGISGIPFGTTLDWSDHNTGSRILNIKNGFNTTSNVSIEVSFQISKLLLILIY